MNIEEGDYVLGLWATGNQQVDWLMSVIKKKGEGFFRGEYRFRSHVDDKIFDSDDEKVWFDVKMINKKTGLPDTEETVVMEIHLVAKGLANEMGSEVTFVPIRSADPQVFADKMLAESSKSGSMFHCKVLEKGSEEAKKYMGASE